MDATPGADSFPPHDGRRLVADALLSQGLDAVIMVDVDLRLTEYAGGAERIFGWTRAEAVGRKWLELAPTEIPSDAEADVWQRVREGRELRVEVRVQRKDGAWRDVRLSVTPLRGAGGGLAGWLGIGRDVTGDNDAKRRLDAVRARLERVLSASNDGYWEWNLESDALFISPRLGEQLGLGPIERLSRAEWQALLHPDDRARAGAALAAALTGEVDHYESEHRIRHGSGRWIWVRGRGRVLRRDEAGAPLLATGVITDITERKEADARASELYDRLVRVLEGSRSAVVDMDLATGVVYRSRISRACSGASPMSSARGR